MKRIDRRGPYARAVKIFFKKDLTKRAGRDIIETTYRVSRKYEYRGAVNMVFKVYYSTGAFRC